MRTSSRSASLRYSFSVFELDLVEYQVHVADDSTGLTDTVGVFT